MPAGPHEILDPVQKAIERRAQIVLAQLHDPDHLGLKFLYEHDCTA